MHTNISDTILYSHETIIPKEEWRKKKREVNSVTHLKKGYLRC